MNQKQREIEDGELTWHKGILGDVGVLGENRKQQKSQNPSCGENDTAKRHQSVLADGGWDCGEELLIFYEI